MARAHTYRTEGIVLRRSDFGEADRLLTILTREKGKIRAIAKGARKPQTRKTGHVELFTRSNFLLATGRNFDIVTQAEAVEHYSGLRADLVRTTYAAYMVELLDQFTADEDQQIQIYDLLSQFLEVLGSTENLLLAGRFYELRLLSLTGYQPQLFYCVVSQESILEEDQYFSSELGGLIKPEYISREVRARPISARAAKVMRYLQTRPWTSVQELQLRRDLHSEIESILYDYLTYLLERSLKSLEFLHRLRHDALKLSETPPAN